MAKVLVLEQSKSVRNNLRERLEFEGFTTDAVATGDEAAALCKSKHFDVIVADDATSVPDCDTPFIICPVGASVESAIDALRRGAIDFLTRPIDMNRLLTTLRGLTDNESVERDQQPSTQRHRGTTRRSTRPSDTTSIGVEPIIGESKAIVRVRTLIDKVAPSEARVLITGENGTGKELVARWLHAKSNRATTPFIEVNCAAIPSELIESELFGHERGAFTSAIKQRKGKFELADGGTLFMDEIGDMSLAAQAKVLRALQERKISRVGSDRDIDVDVRIIAATNKHLPDEIAAGRFREDLYHRIGVIVIDVPPLRERSEDVALLVEHFAEQICNEAGQPKKQFDSEAIALLSKRPWSGNIRQLRNVVERLIILCDDVVTAEDVAAYC